VHSLCVNGHLSGGKTGRCQHSPATLLKKSIALVFAQ